MSPADDEPSAALTSRTAVVAALLMLGAIIVMIIVTQTRDERDGAAPATGAAIEGAAAPDPSGHTSSTRSSLYRP